MVKFGWSTSARVRTLLRTIGADDPGHGPDNGSNIYRIVEASLGHDDALMGGDLDLPLQLIMRHEHRDALNDVLWQANVEPEFIGGLDDLTSQAR